MSTVLENKLLQNWNQNTVLVKAKGNMHPSTTAIITATEYTDGIWLIQLVMAHTISDLSDFPVTGGKE